MNIQSTKKDFEIEINGLRGIAILLVILFHYEFYPFSGGFIGVDIFFVISGYLITKIIINKDTRDLSYLNFVQNRIRRIFPGLIILIIICVPAFSLILSPDHLVNFSQSALSNLFFIPNIYYWTQSNYFDLSSNFKPLLHTWSLGVEFQFYFIWPIFLFFIYKLTKKKYLLNFIFILIIILSIILLEILIKKGPVFEVDGFLYGKFVKDTIFYLTPLRMHEFIFGALLAINLNRFNNNLLNEIIFFIGLLLIFFSSIIINEKYYFPSTISLIPLFGTFLIIFAQKAKLFGYVLRNQLINFFGNISYSLYLYHWPVYIFIKYFKFSELNLFEKIIALIISIIFSYLSYIYIEKFYLNKKNKIFDLRIALTISFIFLVSIHITYTEGWKFRLSENNIQVLNNEQNKYGGLCSGMKIKDYRKKDKCVVGNKNKLDFLLVGDSHGKALISGLTSLAEKNKISFASYEDMCKSYPRINTNIETCLIKENVPKNIILGVKFYSYENEDNKLDEIANEYVQRILKIKLNDIFKSVETIIVIGQVPEFYSTFGDALSCYTRPLIIIKKNCENYLNEKIYSTKYKLKGIHRFYQKKLLNQKLKKHLLNKSDDKLKLIFFDPFDYFCENLKCKQVIDGNLLYSDDQHLSAFGSNYLIKKIEQNIMQNLVF